MNHKEVQMMAAEFVLGTLNRAMLLQFREELTHNPALRAAVKDWERRLGVERTSVTLRPRPQDHAKASLKPRQPEEAKNGAASVDAGEEAPLSAFDIALGKSARCGPKSSEAPPRQTTAAPAPEPVKEDPAKQAPAVASPDLMPVAQPERAAPSGDGPTGVAAEPDRELPLILRADEGEWESLAPRVYKKLLSRDDSLNRQSYLLRMIPGGRIQPQRRGGIEEIYVLEGRLTIGENSLGPGDFHAFPAKSFVPEIAAGGDSLILVRGHIAERIPDPKGTA